MLFIYMEKQAKPAFLYRSQAKRDEPAFLFDTLQITVQSCGLLDKNCGLKIILSSIYIKYYYKY